jgi:thioredoxin reductase (NADPH)
MPAPMIVAVDEDPAALGAVERALNDRYACNYRIACTSSAADALATIERLEADGEDVALVLAGQWLSGLTGTELLARVHRLHPHAKRGLLIGWGEWTDSATARAIYDAMAHGQIDYYVLRPARNPDEHFHHSVSSFLVEWSYGRREASHTIHVVGESWAGRAYELRDVLQRCAFPHTFCLADSDEGRTLLRQVGTEEKLPLVIFPDGNVLADPSAADIAQAVGIGIDPEHDDFDLMIVGAGPAGLSAAVYGASEGFHTLVVDAGGLGGQATSSSLIRNYLGFPRGISGGRLAEQAYEQAWVFGAKFAFMQRVTGLSRENGRLGVDLSIFGRVAVRAVILATGATYRRLGIPALDELNGAGVFYGGPASEAPGLTGHDVCVVGGANSAGQAALHLARYARRVTLAVRAQSLAAGMSHYLARQVEATPNIDVRLGTEVVGGGGDAWLEQLTLRTGGVEETIPSTGLFLMIGARPHTDWLPPDIARDSRGFILTGTDLAGRDGWTLERAPFALETSMPGVFAAGDVRHGSVNRVAAAVGEGGVAIQQVHGLFAAERMSSPGVDEAMSVGRPLG